MPVARILPSRRRSRRLASRPPTDTEYQDSDFDLQSESPRSSDASSFSSLTTPISTPASSPTSSPSSCATSLASDDESVPSARSHSSKKASNHINRPPNAFIVFRSELRAEEKRRQEEESIKREERKRRAKEAGIEEEEDKQKNAITHSLSQFSRMAGELWQSLSFQEQQPWRAKADRMKLEHMILHPGYKYSPNSKAKAQKKRRSPGNTKLRQKRSKVVVELEHEGYGGDEIDNLVSTLEARLGVGRKTRTSAPRTKQQTRTRQSQSQSSASSSDTPASSRRTKAAKVAEAFISSSLPSGQETLSLEVADTQGSPASAQGPLFVATEDTVAFALQGSSPEVFHQDENYFGQSFIDSFHTTAVPNEFYAFDYDQNNTLDFAGFTDLPEVNSEHPYLLSNNLFDSYNEFTPESFEPSIDVAMGDLGWSNFPAF
ncbi:hypothetical protein PHLCEN_2v1052 [Hermanssonia centrifuga]|uniref:HMG box domain-containing protein n=1 Tax=Hermanssonia centrifuga TaxID=98765 RepID=A0A2R6S4N4_9APHY|nr:hypothetical protein PHLCEN_2v1052 [Hermanssonia centrifuga]